MTWSEGKVDYKNDIIGVLQRMRDESMLSGGKDMAAPFTKVINQILAQLGPITSIDDIKGVKGVGPRIRSRIAEIISLNKRPVKDLYSSKYIGIDEMNMHINKLMAVDFHSGIQISVAGTFRQGAEKFEDINAIVKYSTDLSLLEAQFAFAGLLSHLCSIDYIIAETAIIVNDVWAGHVKLWGAAYPKRQLTIRLSSAREYSFALLFSTGPAAHIQSLVQHSKNMGYVIDERGISAAPSLSDDDDTKLMPIPPILRTEHEIYEFLGLKYISPEERAVEEITSLLPSLSGAVSSSADLVNDALTQDAILLLPILLPPTAGDLKNKDEQP